MPTLTNYQNFMLPVLKALANGTETSLADIRERVAVAEGFTNEQLAEEYPSGGSKFAVQVQFALLGLMQAGLIERVRRAV